MRLRHTLLIALAALSLSGCSYIDTSFLDPISRNEQPTTLDKYLGTADATRIPVIPAVVAGAQKDECVVLATALDAVANDWRTNPGERTLKINRYAVSTDRIDGGYLGKASGLLPPKSMPPINVGACGTVLANISSRVDLVVPIVAIPNGATSGCRPTGDAWVSRPGFDADHAHAVALYANEACRGSYWLVRLRKDYRGIWIAEPPDPLYRPN